MSINTKSSSNVKKEHFFLAILAGGIGNVVEWYTFLSYAYLSVVISKLFFPNNKAEVGILLTFLIFAVGFLARPIGAVIFGYLGDRIGRQKTLVFSQVMMAIPTLLICFLPTYKDIGIYAAILLTVMRFLQGVSIAGEYTTSLCYLAEIAPANKRGIFVSVIPATTAFGILISSIVILLVVKFVPEQALYSWGWRASFFVGFILCVFSVWIRRKLPETYKLLNVEKNDVTASKKVKLSKVNMFVNIFSLNNIKSFFLVVFLVISYSYFYQLLYIWLPTFLIKKLNIAYEVSLLFNSIAMIIFTFSILYGGKIIDIIGRKIIVILSSVIIIILFGFLFNLMSSSISYLHTFIFLVIMSVVFGLFVAATSTIFSEEFDIKVRSFTLSAAYNLPYAFVGGLTPAFLQYLNIKYGESSIVSVTIITMFIGLIAVLFIKDKKGKTII
ncbi:MFS transporter [Rickettsiales bacterium LUAb2]